MLPKRGCIDCPEHKFLDNLVCSAVGCRYIPTCERSFSSSSQCSRSHGSTLACSLEISPPPSLLPLHHAPRWSPVPLHSVLPLPLVQPSRSIWPMTRVRATTSLQVIWPPVKSRVRLGGSGSLTDPPSVSFFFRIPPCQQLSHLSQVFIERAAYPFNTCLLCQVSVNNSSFCLSFSSCQEHITSASVAEYHSSDQLGFKMLLSSSEPPPTSR